MTKEKETPTSTENKEEKNKELVSFKEDFEHMGV